MNDTWEWDGTNWTQPYAVSGPQARRYHGMVFDQQRGRMVTFGGNSSTNTHLSETWEWMLGTVFASATAYGTGCGGALPLTLTTASRPVVNATIQVTVSNITPSTPFGAVTLGLTQPPTPIDLTNLGMTGCFQYHDNLVTLLYVPAGASSMVTTLTVPDAIGLPIQVQAFNYDPAAGINPLGAVSSNAITLLCGDY